MGDLGKPIVVPGFEKLPKVQKIAQSGHTDRYVHLFPWAITRGMGIGVNSRIQGSFPSYIVITDVRNYLNGADVINKF